MDGQYVRKKEINHLKVVDSTFLEMNQIVARIQKQKTNTPPTTLSDQELGMLMSWATNPKVDQNQLATLLELDGGFFDGFARGVCNLTIPVQSNSDGTGQLGKEAWYDLTWEQLFKSIKDSYRIRFSPPRYISLNTHIKQL